MIKRIFLFTFLVFISAVPLFSENTSHPPINENDIFSDKDSKYTKSLNRIIDERQKEIAIRLRDLEAKHEQLSALRPDLKDQQTIIVEDFPITFDEGYESNLLKYITFYYKDGKLREVRIGSKKKRIQYEFAFENKSMLVVLPNILESKLVLERFDKTETTILNQMSYDNQIKSLILLESYLRTSIYRMDIIIVLYKEKKDKKNLNQIKI